MRKKYLKTTVFAVILCSLAFLCVSCSGWYTEHTHSFGDWTTVNEPTCTAEGSHKRKCSECEIEETEAIASTGHRYIQKSDGTNHRQECETCGDVKDSAAHTYGTWTEVKEATCTEAGLRKHSCTVCEREETEATESSGHRYNLKFDDTNHRQECEACGDVKDSAAHTYGTWTEVKEATCTEAGSRKHSCTVCGEESSEEIAKLPHTEEWQSDEITLKKICTVCKEVTGDETKTDIFIYSLKANDTEYSVKGLKKGANVSEVIIPSKVNGISVTGIGNYVFLDCKGLTRITIPNSVTSIGASVFSGCTGLTGVTIPDSVTSIGASVFRGCSGLTSIVIPEVKSIETQAFYGCTGLNRIVIPKKVTSIYKDAFQGCTGLTEITVADGNTRYHDANNCVIETAAKKLIFGGKTSIIPTNGSVTSIGDFAFRDCSGLTDIAIPDSVTGIGDKAFHGCIGLTGITVAEGNKIFRSVDNCLIETATKTIILGCMTSIIPTDGSVTGIGNFAFGSCVGLKSLTITDSVTGIGDWSFSYCTELTDVTIPKSVTDIGSYAFTFCSGLTSITYEGTKAEWKAISKGSYWDRGTGDYTVTCTDGTLTKTEADS